MIRGVKLVIIPILVLSALDALGADWPQFGGPTANFLAPDTGINKNWGQRPPQVLWRVSLGDDGFAGPSVAGGKVFITDHAGDQDIVKAFNLEDGKEVWRYSYQDTDKPNYGFARSTPVFSDGRIYALSRLGLLHCLNAENGTKLWSRNMVNEFGGKRPKWDYAWSPVVDGDRLVILPGGSNAAVAVLNKATGETIWTGGGSDGSGYSTPRVATILDRKQYVAFMATSLIGVDAAHGKLLWSVPWQTNYDVNAAMPIVVGNFVFITSGYNHGCALFEITPQGPDQYWAEKFIVSHFSSPVFYNRFVYGTGDSGHLVCLNTRDPKVMWRQAGFQKGGLVAVDGVLIVMDDKQGDVVMVNASTDGYQELGRIKPLGGQSWTAPVIANGKLIVRNKQAMACLDLM